MRRKRAKYTWFPINGSSFGASEGDPYTVNSQFGEVIVPVLDITAPTTENGGLSILSLVPDFTVNQDNTAANTLLDKVQGQEYVLKRIVGKIFVSQRSFGVDEAWPATIVTAGIFVARAIDDSQGEVDLQDNEVDPNDVHNIEQPWIWRRSWKLGDPATTDYALAGAWPTNNAGYPGVMDGPHIDAKVARRVRREHRLWLAVSAFGVSPSGLSATGQAAIDYQIDIRLLGAMRKGRNESSF